MLHKLQLIVMYMYGGPLENRQHLYLYGRVTSLWDEYLINPSFEARILKTW